MKTAVSRRAHGDILVLRWGLLSAVSLAATVLAQAWGLFAWVGERVNVTLAAAPFYLKGNGLLPAMTRAELFVVSVAFVLYGSMVLLRERSRAKAAIVWGALLLAAALPTLIAALWDVSLNMAAPVFGLMIAGVLRLATPWLNSGT